MSVKPRPERLKTWARHPERIDDAYTLPHFLAPPSRHIGQFAFGINGQHRTGIFQIMNAIPIPVATIGLLFLSNIFMTFAWYGHLKFKAVPLITVIFISWSIAFFEYCFQVPANRIGHGYFTAAELKTIQEVITLFVFALFSIWYLGEPLKWNHLVGFTLIAAGAFFIFQKW